MPTKTAKKNVKKVVKKATKKVAVVSTTVTMTMKQALNLQAFASKNNKSFKFLDTKLSALKA